MVMIKDTTSMHFSNLVELLQYRALKQPDKLAYVVTNDGEHEGDSMTFKELDQRARSIAMMLKKLGEKNSKALLLYPPGLEYIAAFFGCLYAGITAVPCYPMRKNRHDLRLDSIIRDSQATVILTTRHNMPDEKWRIENYSGIKWLASDYSTTNIELLDNIMIDNNMTAFLQYTSGSTSLPKGVMVSHKNLMYNLELIRESFELTSKSKSVIWLPPYHDMGLIGGILESIYTGYTVYLMTPVAFISKPVNWLKAITKYRATVSGGPNFAYDLCTKRITEEQKKDLDLSSWITAFNGAEAVRHNTIEDFYQAFRQCGFSNKAFYPCYGLAEATLLVSGGANNALAIEESFDNDMLEQGKAISVQNGEVQGKKLIGCGHNMNGQVIRIVEPVSELECNKGEVGEIWVKGASIAKGYWNKPVETNDTFNAYINDTHEGPFLRTGDLGFLNKEELFVTGRIKDMIIIRGRNYYPHDIENTAEEAHTALRPSFGVAFSIDVLGEEKLVLIHEIERTKRKMPIDGIAEIVRKAISEEYQLQVYDFVLLKPGRMPKTSSGKLQRHLCKDMYLRGNLEIMSNSKVDNSLASKPSHTKGNIIKKALESIKDISVVKSLVEMYLLEQISITLGLSQEAIDPQQHFGSIGMDSLMAVQLTHRIETDMGIVISMTDLLDEMNITDLSIKIANQLECLQTNKITEKIESVESGIDYPLSMGQRALWFLHKLAPDSVAYNISSAVVIKSEVNIPAFQQAFDILAERHPLLRVSFAEYRGEPIQQIQEDFKTLIKVEDGQDWDEKTVKIFLDTEANRPFDLEKDQLIRIHIIKQHDKNILLLVMHHIIADFWSFSVLVSDLGKIYNAICTDGEGQVKKCSMSYFDYIQWQKEKIESEEGSRMLAYWEKHIGGELPCLNMPTDYPRSSVQTYNGDSIQMEIDNDLVAALIQLSREQKVTINTTMLTAFYTLAYRYTGEKDIIIGSPAAARMRAEFSEIVGYFTNMLPLRMTIDGNMDFNECLHNVRKMMLEAFEYQDYPFSTIVEELQHDRHISHSPIFQIAFVFQQSVLSDHADLASFALPSDGAKLNLNGLEVESVDFTQKGAPFDIMMMVAEASTGLTISLRYNTDLYEESTIRNILEHYCMILKEIVKAPNTTIAELKILSDIEKNKIVYEWNETSKQYTSYKCIHELFETQAKQNSHKTALIFGKERLTYSQLDERANKLASYLKQLGAGSDVPISICIERSFDMIVCILGVLKSGSAYVPLDTSYPRERLAFMLEDSGSPIVLTSKKLLDKIPTSLNARIVLIDSEWKIIESQVVADDMQCGNPHNLCNIIYTSGSTGQPKGVMIEHRSVSNLIASITDKIDFATDKTIISLTGMSFDIFMVDTLIPLTCGMTVVLTDQNQQKDPNAIKDIVLENNVQMLQATPSRLKSLLDNNNSDIYIGKLKEIMVGGEAFTYPLLQDLRKYDNIKLYNMYAPSETTVYSTIFELEDMQRITIGKPIHNTYIYILDTYGNPQPVGVTGEIYISGDGVARGYLKRPELAAEKFVINPFLPQMIMYKTGDLAKWTKDGNIDYVGRADNQLKIRGHRVEIDEIERRLLDYKHIKAAAIVVKEHSTGDKYLYAYYVSSQKLTLAHLREYLSEWLPYYMLPSYFIEIDDIPVSPNGKVDKKALTLLSEDVSVIDNYTAVTNEIEGKLEGIWKQLLAINKIGISTNFFMCGGDSLKAVALMYRIQSEFNIEIPLSDIFKYPTIRELANYIERAEEKVCSTMPPRLIKSRPETDVYPMSESQKRIFILSSMDDKGITYNMPGSLFIEGKSIDVCRIEKIFMTLIERHEALRTSFSLVNGQPIQKIHDYVDFKVHEMIGDDQEQSEVCHFVQPFDLAKAPLLRVALLKLSDKKYQLLFDMHHIIADGTSINILIEEFLNLFEGEELEEVQMQYKDYSQWQQELMNSPYLDKQKEYWDKILDRNIPILDLPVDYPRNLDQNYDGDAINFQVAEGLTQSLKELADQSGATLNMVLLSAFNIFLSKLSSQEDIIVGTLVAGRGHMDFDHTMGMFVNTIPLINKIEKHKSCLQILEDVRNNCVESFENQEYPFEKMIDMPTIERDAGRTPIFDVMYIYQNTGINIREIDDALISFKELKSTTAKFDITLEGVMSGNSLQFRMEYRKSLFEQTTIMRFSRYFQEILNEIVNNPKSKITDIRMLPQQDRNMLLHTFNDTQVDYPKDKTIDELFEEQLQHYSENVAIVSNGLDITYSELNKHASVIADMLKQQGIHDGDIVALAVPRSHMMISCVLGILKAGGVCLPIDVTYPEERISMILRDSGAKILLKQGNDEIVANCKVEEINIDNRPSGTHIKSYPITKNMSNPAYIIYTSGSTGKPKGVVINHQGIINHMYTKIRELQINDGDILCHNMSSNFVVSIWQIFTPLLTGAKLIIYDENIINNGYELMKSVQKDRVSVLEVVPSLLDTYLEFMHSEEIQKLDLPDLKTVVLTGEKVSPELVNKFYDEYKIELVNAYGQSECSDDTLHYHIPYNTCTTTVPIGRPANNTWVYIIGENQQLQPIGIPGELCISGDGLAIGYLNRAELTKEKFVPNPFVPGEIMYKTGDIAKWRDDGNVEYIGRVDQQVKIRGFRIELGEIESYVLNFPAIRQAVITTRDDKSGRHLCAFYVSTDAIALSELKEYLRKQLPDYMVPAYYKRLESIPMNHNNKVDFVQLSQMTIKLEAGREYIAPIGQVQINIADIWKRALHISKVSVKDSFFDLGGHSLTALQIVYQINRTFKVTLSLKHFFEMPTIDLLSDYIQKELVGPQRDRDIQQTIQKIEHCSQHRYEPFPLTKVQEAYWIGRQEGYELGNTAAHGYAEIDIEDLDIERFELALQKLIERHDMLRAIILMDGQQKVLRDVPYYHMERYDLINDSDEQVLESMEEVRRQMSHQVLPSHIWPLFDIRVSVLLNGNTRLHISMDLLIADAWSFKILSRELSILYDDLHVQLPELEISFRDYVLAYHDMSNSENYKRSVEYWNERIKKLPPAPELPLVANPHGSLKPHFVRKSAKLDKQTWTKLKEKMANKKLTPSVVLVTAFSEVLSRWSRNTSFTINMTLFNRLPIHHQVNDIVGDFTTLSLLTIDNILNSDFKTCAYNLQEQLLDNLEHRYVSGVHVMREYAKIHGGTQKAIMPVVFTSMLHESGPKERLSDSKSSHLLDKEGVIENGYGISQTPQVWLDYQVAESNGNLIINWDAVEALFPQGMLNDMFESYCSVLHKLTESDEAWNYERSQLVDIPVLQCEVIESINQAKEVVKEQTLNGLFTDMVKRQPDNIAIATSDMSMTYHELYSNANRVGRWVKNNGGENNQLVAIVMKKGWEQVVAALGILQSGAAYLPIDPELPSERIDYLLDNGNIQLVVTHSTCDVIIDWPQEITCLYVDKVEVLQEIDSTPIQVKQKPDDLAYVIYTSGTTGNPKGVMIEHQSSVNTIMDINNRFDIKSKDRVLALSSMSFDLSVYDVFGILAAGGTIVIPDNVLKRDPSHWLELMDRNKVTIWNTVPALMEMLVEYVEGLSGKLPESLRLVLMSGDWIAVDLPERIQSLLESVSIVSLGGATEASIWSVLYPITEIMPNWTSIPYGKPMMNQTLHVLDQDLSMRPIWAVGEIYIGGVGLAKGYWHDMERTETSFIIHPRSGERLYRTGDYGRYLDDGNIEFLGREDYQVKIQGYRIELGEVEAALTQHPYVKNGVITVTGEKNKSKQLVAYFVNQDNSEINIPQQMDTTEEKNSYQGVITDPLERFKFKLGHHGIKNIETANSSIKLYKPKINSMERSITRKTTRHFEDNLISLKQFSQLMSCLMELKMDERPLPKYQYASAGSLYPVQIYVYIRHNRIEGIEGGIYYYHPEKHKIVLINGNHKIEASHYTQGNKVIYEQSAFTLFFIGELDAIMPMYGDWSRDFCMIETGLITQMMEMNAIDSQIGLCQIGGFDFQQIRGFFQLKESQIYLHSIVGGSVNGSNSSSETIHEDYADMNKMLDLLNQSNEKEIITNIQSYMKEKLPSYMIPSKFVPMKELPLSKNGKIDRHKLPQPEDIHEKDNDKDIHFCSNIQQIIHSIWKEVLQVEHLGIHDHFFDLGGTSIHLIRIHNKIRDEVGIKIPIVKLFEHTSIYKLSLYLENGEDNTINMADSEQLGEKHRSARQRKFEARRQKRGVKNE